MIKLFNVTYRFSSVGFLGDTNSFVSYNVVKFQQRLNSVPSRRFERNIWNFFFKNFLKMTPKLLKLSRFSIFEKFGDFWCKFLKIFQVSYWYPLTLTTKFGK